jgi:predicted phosphodiesterase
MRRAIISDLHANLEALTQVLADIDRQKCDDIICLGDLVNYGANPNEVIALLDKRKVPCLLGNHDQYVQTILKAPHANYDADYFDVSQTTFKSIKWTVKNLSDKNIEFLFKSTKPKINDGKDTYAHGSPRPNLENVEYLLPINRDAELVMQNGKETFDLFEKNCFVGHSHLSGIAWKENDKFPYFSQTEHEKSKFSLPEKTLVIVGSVGQPRDGDVRSCYVIYDKDKNCIEFRRVYYNIQKTANAIIKAGLPEKNANRLFTGL